MNRYLFYTLFLFACPLVGFAQHFKLLSPDKGIHLEVSNGADLSFTLMFHGKTVATHSILGMELADGQVWGHGDKVSKGRVTKHQGDIKLVVGNYDKIKDDYSELKLVFDKGYSVVFRVYNDGMAYRFQANGNAGDSITVANEKACFNLSDNPAVVMPETNTFTAWELSHREYDAVSEIENGKYGITPMLFDNKVQNIKIVIGESDLNEYPGMYLRKNGTNMDGFWARYPKEIGMGSWGNFVTVVKQREDYIAHTPGNHLFPWRFVVVADDDRQLLSSNMVYLLAKPLQLKNTSWIKPGKATWEWWHCAILEKAPFESGPKNLSTELYKYYIDFASENKLEYLLIDAGWSNLFRPNELNPNVDVKQLIQYGKEKKVGIFLWTVASTLMKNPHKYLDSISSWGAAGVKIDFFDRDDAQIVPYYEELAKACADRKLLVDFHGCSKPTGLNRAYPNILTYEAVRGMECSKWDTSTNPDYRLQFIFSRMLAGPIDYTPGSMRNSTMANFKPIDPGLPMSLGTRCQELAEYIIISSPLAMLADSPDEYRKYPDILNYLSEVPTTWDDTKIIAAKYGEYAVIAKRSHNVWYVGGMSGWKGGEVDFSLSFLPKGKKYHAEIFKDAPEADRDANQYLHETKMVKSDTSQQIKFAKGGGFVMVIKEQCE